MNLIFDSVLFPIVQEFYDSLKIVRISPFKLLAFMQDEYFVLVDGRKLFVNITFTDLAMRNILKEIEEYSADAALNRRQILTASVTPNVFLISEVFPAPV